MQKNKLHRFYKKRYIYLPVLQTGAVNFKRHACLPGRSKEKITLKKKKMFFRHCKADQGEKMH